MSFSSSGVIFYSGLLLGGPLARNAEARRLRIAIIKPFLDKVTVARGALEDVIVLGRSERGPLGVHVA